MFKKKNKLLYDPAIPLLGIYLKNMKTQTWKDICTKFIAALFTIAKIWKQLKCSSMNEWIKKMWCIYTMACYSAIKKNEIWPFATTWMDLESIMLSELVRWRKTNTIWFHQYVESKKKNQNGWTNRMKPEQIHR